MAAFLTWIPDCDSRSPTLLFLFISSDASILFTEAFTPMENSDHAVISVLISEVNTFYCRAYDYSCTDWHGICDH